MSLVFQILSARIAVVTDLSLAQILKIEFPRLRFLLWILVEFAIIGADVQSLVGMLF